MIKKRIGIRAPFVTSDCKLVVIFAPSEFIIYEHFGTWYLKIQ